MPDVVMSVRDVSYVYGAGESAVQALRSVTFDVREDELLAVTGPSGSGKSTLLNVLGVLDRPHAGQIMIGGMPVEHLASWEQCAVRNHYIGFVFQSFHLLPARTAIQNVELPLEFRSVPRAQRRDQAAEALRSVGLGGHLDRFPSQLSGGQQQRVSIARALVTQPALLLCDEPTGNLDRQTGRELLDLLLTLPGPQRAVVVVTHDEEVASRAHRRIHIVDGQVDAVLARS